MHSNIPEADKPRLDDVAALREVGIEPYPYSYRTTRHADAIKKEYQKLEGKGESIAGRVMQKRQMGGITFFDIQDKTGRIQILVRGNELDETSKKVLAHTSIGDIIGVRGTVMKTKSGEITIAANGLTMLSKTLRSLPNKWQGLTDVDARYRNRHLDLIMNREMLRAFEIRAQFIQHIRDTLNSRGALEVETPILQEVYGGANAKPFKTKYNTLGNADMYLRISDELYLKRLIIGGAERVYEVSKDFRNEDADTTHNPEFTQIEYYEAYSDYEDFMKLVEELFSSFVKKTFGSYKIEFQGEMINFSPPFKKLYWVDELKKRCGVDVSHMGDEDASEVNKNEKLGLDHPNAYHVADALFDKYLKEDLLQPTFVTDFPVYMCPLTKVKRGNSLLAERFELYVARREIANSYSELTDPAYQRKMFMEQEAERKKGDAEAPPFDEAFLEAIEYGMPPTAGIGISIDRPSMIFTNNTSIKEVIFFPPMKPVKKEERKEKAAEGEGK